MKDLLLQARVVGRTSNKKIHVVIWQTTSNICTRKRVARAARLFFFIQPIKSLIGGVVFSPSFLKLPNDNEWSILTSWKSRLPGKKTAMSKVEICTCVLSF